MAISVILTFEGIAQRTGLTPPSVQEDQQLRLSVQRLGVEDYDNPQDPPIIPLSIDPNASYVDLRQLNLETPIKDQGDCGSCWVFATLSAYESSYAARNNGRLVDVSDQSALNCSRGGSCNGGWPMRLTNWWIANQVALPDEQMVPYRGVDRPCTQSVSGQYKLLRAEYLDTRNYNNIPTVRQIKEAIARHGSIQVAMNSTPGFANYTGGVFRADDRSDRINHAVVISGWDDSKRAWLVRNSWGSRWGENGYAWVAYGANNIGAAAIWLDAEIDHNAPTPSPIASDATLRARLVTRAGGEVQLYEEIRLSINGKPYLFSLNRDQGVTEVKVPLEVSGGPVSYTAVATTVSRTNGQIRQRLGRGQGQIQINSGRNYRLAARYTNQSGDYELLIQELSPGR